MFLRTKQYEEDINKILLILDILTKRLDWIERRQLAEKEND